MTYVLQESCDTQLVKLSCPVNNMIQKYEKTLQYTGRQLHGNDLINYKNYLNNNGINLFKFILLYRLRKDAYDEILQDIFGVKYSELNDFAEYYYIIHLYYYLVYVCIITKVPPLHVMCIEGNCILEQYFTERKQKLQIDQTLLKINYINMYDGSLYKREKVDEILSGKLFGSCVQMINVLNQKSNIQIKNMDIEIKQLTHSFQYMYSIFQNEDLYDEIYNNFIKQQYVIRNLNEFYERQYNYQDIQDKDVENMF